MRSPSSRPRPPSTALARRRPRVWRVEALEVRALLSVVSNAGDSGPGSLRNAIDNATPGEVITVDPSLSGSYIGLRSRLEIKTSLTIQGLGADNLTIDGHGNGNDFRVDAGVTATISGLTITGGYAGQGSGGGIDNAGTLTLTGVQVSGNVVEYDFSNSGYKGSPMVGGGGIFNTGSLTLSGVAVTGNEVKATDVSDFYGVVGNTVGGGGGIWNNGGTLTVLDSVVSGNWVYGYAINTPDVATPRLVGGGIENSGGGVTTILGSALTGNGVSGLAQFGYSGTTVGEPVASAGGDAYGGGIASDSGRLLIDGSTISTNSVQGNDGAGGVDGNDFGGGTFNSQAGGPGGSGVGGGIAVTGGTATIESCGITGNTATGGKGGPAGSGFVGEDPVDYPGVGGAGGQATGGGIAAAPGTMVSIASSTVTGNTATGGAAGPGGVGIDGDANLDIRPPFTGPGSPGGDGGWAFGGGIAGGAGLTILNATITGNSAVGGPGGHGGNGGNGAVLTASAMVFNLDSAIDGGIGGGGGAGGSASGANLSATAATIVANTTIGPNIGIGNGGGSAGTGGAAGSGFRYDFEQGVYIPVTGTVGGAGSSGAAGLGINSAPFVQLSIQFGGYLYNRATHHFVQAVTVTQVGGPAFGGTLTLALDGLPTGVTLANAAGTTAATLPSGSPFVIVNLEDGPATILLDYTDPSKAQISFTPRLIAGLP